MTRRLLCANIKLEFSSRNPYKGSAVKKFTAVVSSLVFMVLIVVQIVLSVHYDQNIGGHLKRAADANSIELAMQEIRFAITNMEAQSLTSGYTSVIWKTPDEDIGFWYNNIKTAYAELDSLPASTSPLERSNMLIKLRETLLDHTKEGDSVTNPEGISRYPNNKMFFWLTWSSLFFSLAGWGAIGLKYLP